MNKITRTDANNCGSVRPLLSPYIDRRTTPEETRQVEQHLATCERCRTELEQLRTVVQGLRALPEVPVPRTFTLPSTMVRAPRAPLFASILQLRRVAYSLAASLLVLLGANLYLGSAYLGAPGHFVATSAGVERQAAPLAAPAAASAPPPSGAGDVSRPTAAESEPSADAAAPQAAPLAAATAPAAAPEPPSAQQAPPPLMQEPAATPSRLEAKRAAEAPPGLGAAPSPDEAGEPPLLQQKAGVVQQMGQAQPSAYQTLQVLWTAELVVAIALLLAAVGAFLGAPGRQR